MYDKDVLNNMVKEMDDTGYSNIDKRVFMIDVHKLGMYLADELISTNALTDNDIMNGIDDALSKLRSELEDNVIDFLEAYDDGL